MTSEIGPAFLQAVKIKQRRVQRRVFVPLSEERRELHRVGDIPSRCVLTSRRRDRVRGGQRQWWSRTRSATSWTICRVRPPSLSPCMAWERAATHIWAMSSSGPAKHSTIACRDARQFQIWSSACMLNGHSFQREVTFSPGMTGQLAEFSSVSPACTACLTLV